MRSRLLSKIQSKVRTQPPTPPPENVSARPAPVHTSLDESRQSPTEATPSLSDCATAQTSLSSLQERLWNQAYDELKVSELKVVDMYETILSKELCRSNTVQNDIGQTTDTRCQQMQKLVQAGLDRSLKVVSMKPRMGDGLDIVQTLRVIVDKAMQAAPQAAVAWVGVCIGLEIISKPITEARSNRKGISYVLSRMNWYWNLAHLLLDKNKAVDSSAELRDELESNMVKLYQKLLLYQIRSVCLYHRKQLIVIGRDLLSLDDWAGQLSDIREAEDAVKKDAEQYNSEQVKEYISSLATIAISQEKKLDDIHLTIQDQTQLQEKRHQDDENKQCLRDLYETNPIKDKERIQDTKGGLLRDSYLWILENLDFQKFRNDAQSRLLWIKGDPGKGKTMLLCGIIDELQKQPDSVLSYFFCQATEPQLNNATSVLRGLMYLLLDKRPSLISHLREKYDTTGEKLFQGINVWGSLVEILTDMLKDPTLTDAIFVVDALDECTTNRSRLLDFIIKSSSPSFSVKWIVSSRNWPEIEEQLDTATQRVRLQLELNQNSISDAITSYIDHKVDQLGRFKNYDEGTRHAVRHYLAENASGTFLWVALVCQELADPKVKRRHTLTTLKAFPPGLNSLYGRMMKFINDSADAAICKQVLAVSSVVYRPVSLQELKILAESLEDFDRDELREITTSCGSFLTLREDIVYFVHQSAKDYLLNEASDDILPSGISELHHAIFLKSLKALSQTLKRDIYNLGAPGSLIDQFSPPDLDPLAPLRYSTLFWVDHLDDSKSTETENCRNVRDSESICDFMRKKYLYWLESLSLLHYVPEGVQAVEKLEDIARSTTLPQLVELLQDARRFILYHRLAIQLAPLQLYSSALVFSPASSLVRVIFKKEEPDWITLKSVTRMDWGECLQTLEGHSRAVHSVAFSHDSKLVASASCDETIRVWRADTGECTQNLKGHSDLVNSVAFSHDSQLLVSASNDKTIRIWWTDTGEFIQTLEGHSQLVNTVAFSHNSKLVVSASRDNTIRIWRADTGECTRTLKGHTQSVKSVAFSHDSKLVASASRDKMVCIWRADTGERIQTLKGHSLLVNSVAFSHDSRLIASASYDETIRIWRADTGECTQKLKGHSDLVNSVAFSHDSKLVASASDDKMVRIWRVDSNARTQMLEGHNDWVSSVTFSHDSKLVASASFDKTVRIWCADVGRCTQMLEGHSDWVNFAAFSHDSKLVASASYDKTIRIWRADTGECTQALKGHNQLVHSLAFSYDSKLLVSASDDKMIRIWRAHTGECTQTLEGHSQLVNSVVFSHDSKLIASASYDETIRIWQADTGECTQVIGIRSTTTVLSFELDNAHLLTTSGSFTIPGMPSVYSSAGLPNPAASVLAHHSACGISQDARWVVLNGEKMLWLPVEFRPRCWAVSESTIVIGCGSGSVIILKFSCGGDMGAYNAVYHQIREMAGVSMYQSVPKHARRVPM